MEQSRIGIYLNAKERTVVRITSAYWIPEEPAWLLLTNKPNATLVTIRDIIKKQGLMPDPSSISWGSLPLRE
jgi:hypothetical protein